jgi:hypothetical protein
MSAEDSVVAGKHLKCSSYLTAVNLHPMLGAFLLAAVIHIVESWVNFQIVAHV